LKLEQQDPERFIESNPGNSWLEYLDNMSVSGTWADAIIIQAVADQLQLKLFIVETHQEFQECTIIQPVSATQQLTNIYLGHISEYHYVSTLLCSSMSSVSSNIASFTPTLNTIGVNMTYILYQPQKL
jgi:hypothetical protein